MGSWTGHSKWLQKKLSLSSFKVRVVEFACLLAYLVACYLACLFFVTFFLSIASVNFKCLSVLIYNVFYSVTIRSYYTGTWNLG